MNSGVPERVSISYPIWLQYVSSYPRWPYIIMVNLEVLISLICIAWYVIRWIMRRGVSLHYLKQERGNGNGTKHMARNTRGEQADTIIWQAKKPICLVAIYQQIAVINNQLICNIERNKSHLGITTVQRRLMGLMLLCEPLVKLTSPKVRCSANSAIGGV